MARSLSGIRLEAKISATLTNSLTDSSSVSIGHPNVNYKPTITNGLNANQANRSWQSKSRFLPSAGNETLDLYDMASIDIGAGAGLDGLGQAVLFEEIVGILIVNENAVTSAAQLGIAPAAANGWAPIGTHSVATGGALRGQGCLLKTQVAEQGFDITDASSHRITFSATGGDIYYSIYLLGRHDDNESSSSSSSSSSASSSSSSSSSQSSSCSCSTSTSSASSASSSSPSSSSPTSYSSSTT